VQSDATSIENDHNNLVSRQCGIWTLSDFVMLFLVLEAGRGFGVKAFMKMDESPVLVEDEMVCGRPTFSLSVRNENHFFIFPVRFSETVERKRGRPVSPP
jgi:hypothetical protein